MHVSPRAKLYEVRPLTGPLDPQTSPDSVVAGAHRWVQNFRVNAAGTLERSKGWTKLFPAAGVNTDLRDQLLDKSSNSSAAEEEITLVEQVKTTEGIGKLVAGTKSRLYSYNPKTKNWKLIGDELSGSGRWKVAYLGDDCVFVNDSAKPLHWKIDQPVEGISSSNVNSVKEIEGFSAIGLNRIKHVKEWRGLMFYGNVHEHNEWIPDRLVWSDFKNPLRIESEVEDSLAGYQDLGHGENITGMEPLANSLLVYTERGVWQFDVAGGTGTDVLSFKKRYTAEDGGNSLPFYKNTLVSAGDNHFYLGRDGVYYYNAYRAKPDKPEWLHVASSVITGDINSDLCDLPVASYNSLTDEVWISWPQKGSTKNSKTIIINIKHQHVSYMDAGFHDFVTHTSKSYTSIGDFLTSNCMCTEAKIASFRETPEGPSNCDGSDSFSSTLCSPAIDSIYSTTSNDYNAPYDSDSITAENFLGGESSGSLYTKLGSKKFADLCNDTCDEESVFVMAYTTDNCLKADGGSFTRTRCLTKTGCGIYKEDDFRSLLRSPALRLNSPQHEKLLRSFVAEFEHESSAGSIDLMLGQSAQAVDSNTKTQGCGLVWGDPVAKPIKCVTDKGSNEHKESGTRANEELNWPCYTRGRNIYYQIAVYGTDGQFELSAVRLYAETKKS
jgi:hypothetical protein